MAEKNNITVIRYSGDGLLHYIFKNKVYKANILQGDVLKISDKDFNGEIISQVAEYRLSEISTTDGNRTFILISSAPIVTRGSRGGGKGIKGITVQDEGIAFSGFFQTLNFAGVGVIVTDDGNGKASITIGGGGMVTGTGTINRLAMFTAASTIADSPFLRSGSDVIADGFIYFASGNGIDVTATGGSDVLSIGTSNADVINYGYSGTTHNFSGTVFNENTTNLNVKDKLITINDGGAAASGGSAGFEIEEAGVATGYFIQNTARTGFDFQASAVTGVATFNLALLTANRTATLQDASGTIAYLSDIPAPVAAFVQNGNSFGAPAVLGTNDVFSLSFETSGVTRETISSTGLFGINAAPVVGTLWYQQGTGSTSATYIAQFFNSTPTVVMSIRDDQRVGIRTSAPAAPFHIYSNSNDAIRLSVDGGLANRYRLYLEQVTELAKYEGVNIDHRFYTGGAGTSHVITFHQSQRVSISPEASANYGQWMFYVETSANNDRAIYSKTLGSGNTADFAGYFEAVGTGLKNFAGYFTATGATSNYAISTNAGNVGIGTDMTATGTGNRVLIITNGTAPVATLADSIKIFSIDSSDTLATLGLYLEQTEAVIGATIATHKVKILLNGNERYLLLSTV